MNQQIPITIEPLDKDNWLPVCRLGVSDEQKKIFSVANLYWIGISRYEERSELFAIKRGDQYVGLIGGGLDEDGVSGYINPVMVDKRFQRQGIGERAIRLMMDYLTTKHRVPCIRISHRRENGAASRLYGRLGFSISSETERDIERSYTVDHGVKILSLRDHKERASECRALLLEHFGKLPAEHPMEIVTSDTTLPQGYFMVKEDKVIGWTGLRESEPVSGKVYGWTGSQGKPDVMSEDLSPWISPLLVHPHHRGARYGMMLLLHARQEAGRLGFARVYLTTGEIGYYERYGFREVGLTTFTWGRPTKIYEHDAIR